METFIAQQLQEFAAVGAKTFTGWSLLLMTGLFVLLVLLLCKRAYALYRTLRLLGRSFSEAAMQNSPLLQRYWEEYSHTFLLDLQQNNKTLHDATAFFEPERLVGDVLDLRWWRFSPHVFLALGMAAVLAQLVYGLVLFDPSTPESIMASIEHAFLAIANGFLLLLAGLALGVGMHFAVRKVCGGLARQVLEFAAMLNKRYKITTLEERELTLAEYAKTLTRIVTTLFADSRGSKALTPGVLSRALLDQTRQTNTLLLQRSQEAAAPLTEEQMQHLGRIAGKAMAEELRPLLNAKHTEDAAAQIESASAAKSIAELAAALRASSTALQAYLQTERKDAQQDDDEMDTPLSPATGAKQ